MAGLVPSWFSKLQPPVQVILSPFLLACPVFLPFASSPHSDLLQPRRIFSSPASSFNSPLGETREQQHSFVAGSAWEDFGLIPFTLIGCEELCLNEYVCPPRLHSRQKKGPLSRISVHETSLSSCHAPFFVPFARNHLSPFSSP